jgi:dipeptidase D
MYERVITMVLENLEPKKVFKFFEEICSIPHGSGNLDKISSYLEDFAKKRNLEHIRDKANNVIIIKEATKGYESKEPIILQGHMDMVAVKNDSCAINLETDGLKLKVDGDYLYAEGTSLGGDDGIAVAYMLAILDSDEIAHPRIEAVITTDEETGMDGATAIDLSMLQAKRMLNIDSEEEGVLLTSCAGGMRTDCHIPIRTEYKAGDCYLSVNIGGLQGGHSGTEINKGHINAIKQLAIVLKQVYNNVPFKLLELSGGEKDNAIPRQANAIIKVCEPDKNKFISEIYRVEKIERSENKSREKLMHISASEIDINDGLVFDEESTLKVIDFLVLLPNGVVTMSADIDNLVETSLNVGILKTNINEVVASCSLRSSVESAKHKINLEVETLVKRFGGYIENHGEYPGWQFNPDSRLRADMIRIYKNMFGEEPKVEAMHAGLECGIMISKIPGLDCVSFGPDIFDIHTTNEKLSISSTQRMWEYILEILKA